MADAQQNDVGVEASTHDVTSDANNASSINAPPTATTPSTPAPALPSTMQAIPTTTQGPPPVAQATPAVGQVSIPTAPTQSATQPDQQDIEMPAVNQRTTKLAAVPGIAGQRTGTPVRNTNHVNGVNGVNGTVTAPMPAKATPNGAPTRRYLNEKVTGVLLDGMKRLAVKQPEDPLRVLGEFLLQKSKELEGTK